MSQINISSSFCSIPIRFGIVGTGYAANARAKALKADERSLLVTVAGHTASKNLVKSLKNQQILPRKTPR